MENKFTISTLGTNGRFGNQIFQYLFGKSISIQFGCQLEIPDNWIGRKIFDITDNGISSTLPKTPLDFIPSETGWDLFGYYQYQQAIKYNHNDIRNWLKIKQEWIDIIEKDFPYVNDYVCFHLRRGDYKKLSIQKQLCLPSLESYVKHLKTTPYKGMQIVLCSDDTPHPTNLPSDISFLMDFMIMIRAKVLFRANSTFSFWAHEFNKSFRTDHQDIFSPIVYNKFGYCDVEFTNNNYECMVSKPDWNQSKIIIE